MLARSLAVAALLGAATAHAQSTTPAAAPAPRTRAVSVQPLAAIAAVYAGEYEQAVSPSLTVGLGATGWFGWFIDDLTYTSADLKARYYVNATPLEGLSVGGSVGYARISESISGTRTSVAGPTASAMIDYGWLLGRTRALYVGVGAGGKVVLVNVGSFVGNVPLQYPTFRASIGRAF